MCDKCNSELKQLTDDAKEKAPQEYGAFSFLVLYIWLIDGLNYISFLSQRLIEFFGMGSECIFQHAEVFDSTFYGVPGLQEIAGCHRHAGRCSGGYYIARF